MWWCRQMGRRRLGRVFTWQGRGCTLAKGIQEICQNHYHMESRRTIEQNSGRLFNPCARPPPPPGEDFGDFRLELRGKRDLLVVSGMAGEGLEVERKTSSKCGCMVLGSLTGADAATFGCNACFLACRGTRERGGGRTGIALAGPPPAAGAQGCTASTGPNTNPTIL